MLCSRVDYTQQPILAKLCFPIAILVQGLCCVGEEYGGGLLARCTGERGGDCISPELHAHCPNGGMRGGVCHAGGVYVEGTQGEVGISSVKGDEWLHYRGRIVILPCSRQRIKR